MHNRKFRLRYGDDQLITGTDDRIFIVQGWIDRNQICNRQTVVLCDLGKRISRLYFINLLFLLIRRHLGNRGFQRRDLVFHQIGIHDLDRITEIDGNRAVFHLGKIHRSLIRLNLFKQLVKKAFRPGTFPRCVLQLSDAVVFFGNRSRQDVQLSVRVNHNICTIGMFCIVPVKCSL